VILIVNGSLAKNKLQRKRQPLLSFSKHFLVHLAQKVYVFVYILKIDVPFFTSVCACVCGVIGMQKFVIF
jgi:hypothetical protein